MEKAASLGIRSGAAIRNRRRVRRARCLAMTVTPPRRAGAGGAPSSRREGPLVAIAGLVARTAPRTLPVEVVVVCAYVAAQTFAETADVALPLLGCTSLFIAARGLNARRENVLLLPSAAFLGSTLLSTLLSEDVELSLRRCVPLLPCVLLFVLVAARFESRHVKVLYATLAGLAAVVGLRLLVQCAADPTATPTAWVEAVRGPLLVVPNDAIFLVSVMPLALALAFSASGRRIAVLGLAMVILGLAVVVVLRSRGATLLALVVVPATLGALRMPRRVVLAAIAGMLLVGMAVDGLTGFALTARFGAVWTTRIPIWLTAVAIFRDAPFFGVGPHVFGEFFEEYLWTPSWSAFDYRASEWAHNLYLELLAEQGIVGLGAFAAVLGCFFRRVHALSGSRDRE